MSNRRPYTPRRASSRWLDSDCPAEVLAIFEDPREPCERFTVFYRTPVCGTRYADSVLGFRGMSENPSHPQGVGMYGEMSAHDAAEYRRRNHRFSATWSSLPDAVKRCVVADCEGVAA